MFKRKEKGARQIVVSTRSGSIQISSSNPDDGFKDLLGAVLGLHDVVMKGKVLTELEKRDHR